MKSEIIFIAILLFAIMGCGSGNQIVKIETEVGIIRIELYPNQAPVTVSNFLRYVDMNLYEGATFYRTVREGNQPDNEVTIDVIQGGLYDETEMFAPIIHETTEMTGILHKDGVISMARNEPGTATSEIFICVGDQPELDWNGNRNADKAGFASFGKVIEGMDIVRKIHQMPQVEQMLLPKVKIISIKRD